MRTLMAVTLLVGMALCLAASASAEPSLYGYTGLIVAPTARVAPLDYVEAGLNTNELEDFDDVTWLANFGANEGLEVGFAHIEMRGGVQETVINGKYVLRQEDDDRPAIAVGVFDITDGIDATAYLALSRSYGKELGSVRGKETRLLSLHGGFGGGLIDGLFVASELQIGKEVTAQFEWVSDNFNTGAVLRPCDRLTVGAAWVDFNDVAVTASLGFQIK
ncbi:MAG: YjbH domain-containing protein [Armatimonadota bacterium]